MKSTNRPDVDHSQPKTTRPDRGKNPALVYLARLSPASQRIMKHALEVIAPLLTEERIPASRFQWSDIRQEHTATIRARLAEQYAPSTVNKMLAALRGVLREAWQLGQMSAEDYHRARDVRGLKSGGRPAGRALAPGELQRIFAVCRDDDSPGGARDAAILALLYGAGLRRAEVAGLNLSDYHPETGRLRIRRGPGRRARYFRAVDSSRSAMEAWLGLRDDRPGPLFCPVNKGGRIVRKRLSPQAIYLVCRKRSRQAGIRGFSPNDLRRTFIGDLIDAGADLLTTQHLARHAHARSTARYVDSPAGGKAGRRRCPALLPIPYGS